MKAINMAQLKTKLEAYGKAHLISEYFKAVATGNTHLQADLMTYFEEVLSPKLPLTWVDMPETREKLEALEVHQYLHEYDEAIATGNTGARDSIMEFFVELLDAVYGDDDDDEELTYPKHHDDCGDTRSDACIADSYAVPCGMEEEDEWHSDLY